MLIKFTGTGNLYEIIFKCNNNQRAISPMIATLLLFAVAVASSGITYSWVMSIARVQAVQAQTQVREDGIHWDVANNKIIIKIRNSR